jgi:hypothetical protein
MMLSFLDVIVLDCCQNNVMNAGRSLFSVVAIYQSKIKDNNNQH